MIGLCDDWKREEEGEYGPGKAALITCPSAAKRPADFHRSTPEPWKGQKFCLLSEAKAKDSQRLHQHPKQQLTADDVYEDNGGTILAAVIGKKLVIASDTRHSAEYNINSRFMSRIFRINNFFLCSSGFYADSFNIYKELKWYCMEYENNRPITLKAAAHVLCNILYSRRFFPYQVYPCLSGFDEDGEPAVYSFDCVGSYQKVKYRCDGSAVGMIQPLLDSWLSGANFQNFVPLDFDSTLTLIKAAFNAAAEIDVKTKDFLEIFVADGTEVKYTREELRKD